MAVSLSIQPLRAQTLTSSPDATGPTEGADTITGDTGSGSINGGTGIGTLTTLGGDDVITIFSDGGTIDIDIDAGAGNDIINITEDSGTDILILRINQSVLGGDGRDRINLRTIDFVGLIDGGADDDQIFMDRVFSGAFVVGAPVVAGPAPDVLGGSGNDRFTIQNGTRLDNSLRGGTGDDIFTITTGPDELIVGQVPGITYIAGGIFGEDGNDRITVTDAGIDGMGGTSIDGGAGDDRIEITNIGVTQFGDVVGDATEDFSMLNGNVLGGTGMDSILITNSTTDGNNPNNTNGILIDGGDDADTITIRNSSMLDDSVTGGAGDDRVVVEMGSRINSLGGGANDDYLELNASIANEIDGGTGNDQIIVVDSTVNNSLMGNDGDDNFVIRNSTIADALDATAIDGGAGNDTIAAQGPLVVINADILGGADNDTILVDNVTMPTANDVDIDGGIGDDSIRVLNQSSTNAPDNILGGAGVDQIEVNNSTVQTNVQGDDGNDDITVSNNSDIGGLVDGGANDDTIRVGMSRLRGPSGVALQGGTGNDKISIVSTTVDDGDINGDSGNDEIRISDSTLSNANTDVDGGTGNDLIEITRTPVGGMVRGGANNDTITITSSDIEGQVDAGSGDDIININSANLNGAATAGSGADTVNLNGLSTVTGNLDGSTNDDTLNINLVGVSPGDVAALNLVAGNADQDFTFDSGVTLNWRSFQQVNVNAASFMELAPQGMEALGAALDEVSPFINAAPGTSADFQAALSTIAVGDVAKNLRMISPVQYVGWDAANFVDATYTNRMLENKVMAIRSGRAAGLAQSFTLHDGSIDRFLRSTATRLAQVGPTIRSDSFRPSYLRRTTQETQLREAQALQQAGGRQDAGMWLEGGATYGEIDEYGEVEGLSMTNAGAHLGGDWRLGDTFALGAFGGYTNNAIDFENNAGRTDIQSANIGLYGTYFEDGVFVNASFTYSRKWYSGTRNMNLVTPRTAKFDTEGNQYNFYANAGYDFRTGDGFRISPSLGFQYVRSDYDGFSETGAGALSLTVDDREAESLQSILGVRASYRADIGVGYLHPEISAYWLHEFLEDDREISAAFADPAVSGFGITTDSQAQDSALLGAGLTAELVAGENWTSLFFRYNAQISPDNMQAHGVNSGMRVDF